MTNSSEQSGSAAEGRDENAGLNPVEPDARLVENDSPGTNVRGRGGGPQTASGKENSSKNAVIHGINSNSPVAGGELEEDWVAFSDGVLADLRPVGVLQTEIATEIASLLWRKRRVRRAEVGYINSLYEAIDLPDRTLDPSNVLKGTFGPERYLEEDGCDLHNALALLDNLGSMGDDETFERGRALNLAKLMSVMCSIQTEKLVRPTLLADDPCTAEQMRKYILRCSELMGIGYKQLVNRAKKLVVQILTDHQSREEDQRRTRRTRERAAVLPKPNQVDSIIRHDSHLDRSLARKFAELELLQRVQSGQQVPAPVRIQVDDHRSEAS